MPAPKSAFLSHGVPADPCPDLPIEEGPAGKGVGAWVPQDKHRLLAEYLHGTRYAWAMWPTRTLLDPFCATGRIRVEGEQRTRDGGALVAWRELQHAGVPFTHVFVGDLDPTRSNACAQRLQALGANVRALAGPASQTLPQMVAAMPEGGLALAFLDPYNLGLLSFDLFQALARRKVDVACHFSTMDLTRNIDLEFANDGERFDATNPGWRERIPVAKLARRAAYNAFLADWQQQLGRLGFACSEAMPLITNRQGHGLYRMVFAAGHDMPRRVWSDVARGPNRSLDLF